LPRTSGAFDIGKWPDATPLADFTRRYAIAREDHDERALLPLGRPAG
jgi:hypothetical protein